MLSFSLCSFKFIVIIAMQWCCGVHEQGLPPGPLSLHYPGSTFKLCNRLIKYLANDRKASNYATAHVCSAVPVEDHTKLVKLERAYCLAG